MRTKFIQGAGYELAWEAILLLAVVPFPFVRLWFQVRLTPVIRSNDLANVGAD